MVDLEPNHEHALCVHCECPECVGCVLCAEKDSQREAFMADPCGCLSLPDGHTNGDHYYGMR